MITRAKFQNFKALRDVEITFDSKLTVLVGPNGCGNTVLVGPNGCGKTSVLQGIRFVGQFSKGDVGPQRFWSEWPEWPPRGRIYVYGWNAQPPVLIEEQTLRGASINIDLEDVDNVQAEDRYQGLNSEPVNRRFTFSKNGSPIHYTDPTFNQVRSAIHLELDPAQLRRPSFTQAIPPVMNPDGSGLASALAYIARKHPETFKKIVESLREVIPTFESVRLDYAEFDSNPKQFPDVLVFDFMGSPGLRPGSVSDGTLIVLGLLTSIFGPNQPKLILLDDLNHRLHPNAQMQLVELLRKLLEQFPGLQIIATSHSPYVLDKLQPNEVRVMALDERGHAVCARLEDHPQFPMWKDSMAPGEFWSHAGEDWVKELTAQPTAS